MKSPCDNCGRESKGCGRPLIKRLSSLRRWSPMAINAGNLANGTSRNQAWDQNPSTLRQWTLVTLNANFNDGRYGALRVLTFVPITWRSPCTGCEVKERSSSSASWTWLFQAVLTACCSSCRSTLSTCAGAKHTGCGCRSSTRTRGRMQVTLFSKCRKGIWNSTISDISAAVPFQRPFRSKGPG